MSSDCASRSLYRLKRHLKLLVLHGNPCDDPPADLCVHDSVSSLTSYVYNAQSTEGTVHSRKLLLNVVIWLAVAVQS